MEEFTIFPAIDLRGGQVVRLSEGDPQRQTAYSSDPRRDCQAIPGCRRRLASRY